MPKTRGRGTDHSSERSSNPSRQRVNNTAREEFLENEALEISEIEFIREEGIQIEMLQDTPIPEKIRELGWERFVRPHGVINKNWVGLVHASNDVTNITDPKRGIMIRGKKDIITPQAVNEYYGTPCLYGTASHPKGFPTDVALDQNFSTAFLKTLRSYPIRSQQRGHTRVNHRELSTPDAFWNIFIRKSIIPRQKNQEPTAENLRVLYSIHTGQGFDLGIVICNWLKEYLKQSSFSRVIFPSLITYFCSKAGVPQKTTDVIMENGLMLDHITWNRALMHRPEGAQEAEGYPAVNPTKSRKRSEASSSKQPDPPVQPSHMYIAEDQYAAMMGSYASTENRMVSQHEESSRRLDNFEASMQSFMESFFTPHFDRIYGRLDSLQTQISNLSIQSSASATPSPPVQHGTSSASGDQNEDVEEPVSRPLEPDFNSIPTNYDFPHVTADDADAILTGSDSPSYREL